MRRHATQDQTEDSRLGLFNLGKLLNINYKVDHIISIFSMELSKFLLLPELCTVC